MDWEEDGSWYPWNVGAGPFAVAWDRTAGLCRAADLTPWYKPTTGGAANASEPSTIDHIGWDIYATKYQSAGAMAEPKMLAAEEAGYWGMDSLLTWKPSLPHAVFEFGVGEEGDDAIFAAGALELFEGEGRHPRRLGQRGELRRREVQRRIASWYRARIPEG